jgi:hypothetical protein
MLVIETYLKEIPGKGLGVFTFQHLPKGAVWHKDEDYFDRICTRTFVERIGMIAFFGKYASYMKPSDSYYLCSDNGRFINHSQNSNTCYVRDQAHSITTRDIAAHEEITCNYMDDCDDAKYNGLEFVPVE